VQGAALIDVPFGRKVRTNKRRFFMDRSRAISRRKFVPAGLAAAGAAGAGKLLGQAAPARARSGRPILDSVDALIVGGGPAGIGAALGAARSGAKTLLIENHSFFGGVAAWSVGMQMNQMRPFGRPRSAVHELLIAKLAAYGEQAVALGEHEVWSNVEYLKVAILDALDEVRAGYLVHLPAVDALVERNRVTGVTVATKRGLMEIRAKVVVDCTGDADVAYFAGAETMTDPDQLMPMTLGLTLNNIPRPGTEAAAIVAAMRAGKGKYPLITSGFLEVKQVAHCNSFWINHAGTADMGRMDATDPRQRTEAECRSRRQALQMVQAIRDSENPNLRQVEWGSAGPQVSVRETRRVKGCYVITEEDAMAGRQFADTIGWRAGYVDLGGQTGSKLVRMKVHDVPYRSLVPEKLDGLLVAGRCISATHVGAAAGKSMGNYMATGHAAGAAAALCAQLGIMPRELKVARLQDKLRAEHVGLDIQDREQTNLRA
jgi:succinate dehydrogenase/fumarate reductase flavoprotein subunit